MRTIELKSAAGTARISVQGAQVLSWVPAGSPDVLWLSPATVPPGKPIRGGIPVCFPWFGARAGDPTAPSHGFARTRDWVVEQVGADVAVFTLSDTPDTLRHWPHRFLARLTVRIGDGLETVLEVENRGDSPLAYEAALHGYLAVGDVEQLRISGLAGLPYVDKVDALRNKRRGPDPLQLSGEVDAVHTGSGPVRVEDPVLGRILTLDKSGSRSTVIWNPGATKGAAMADVGPDWRKFVCVEAANVGPDHVTLAPGDRHALRQVLR